MKKSKSIIWFVVALLILLFGVDAAYADLTVSNLVRSMWGNRRVHIFDVSFDSSYNFGGESLLTTSGASAMMGTVDQVVIYDSGGHSFQYDETNQRVKVFGPAPPIIYEEEHVVNDLDATSPSGTTAFLLDYPAAWIVNIVDRAGNNYHMIYSGTTTLGSSQAALTAPIAKDERTGVTVSPAAGAGTSGLSTFYVTYATQAWQDIHNLLVQNQAIELATGTSATVTGSGNTIFAWGWGKTGSSGVTPAVFMSSSTGFNTVTVDFGESGTTTSYIAVPASLNAQTLYLTYLKYPPAGSWLRERFIFNEDATSATSAMSLDRSLLMWNITGFGFAGAGSTPFQMGREDLAPVHPGDADAATRPAASGGYRTMQPSWGYRGASADAVAPNDHQVWGRIDDVVSLTDAAYIYGHPWEIPNLRMLEMQDGTDLSNLTGVKVLMIGR